MSVYGRSRLFTDRLFTDQQLIELHEQGLNDREIADRLGTDRNTVSRYRRRLRLKPISSIFFLTRKTKNRRSYSRVKFTDQQLIYLHGNGLRDVEIAEKLDANRGSVRYHRKKLGLKAHRLSQRFTDQQLIELHMKGLSDREICEKLGAPYGTIGSRRRDLELKLNRHKPKVAI